MRDGYLRGEGWEDRHPDLRGEDHTEALRRSRRRQGWPASPRRGSPGVREHAWSHLENRRRPARSRDWTTDRLVASVFAPARVGALGFGLGMSGFSSVSPSPTGRTVVRWKSSAHRTMVPLVA